MIKQDIIPKNDKDQRHGLCIYYYNNELWYKGICINDIRCGLWIDKWFFWDNKPKITFYLE